MLSYQEIYERLHGNGWSEKDIKEAVEELATMSNEEWLDYVCYRNDREKGK